MIIFYFFVSTFWLVYTKWSRIENTLQYTHGNKLLACTLKSSKVMCNNVSYNALHSKCIKWRKKTNEKKEFWMQQLATFHSFLCSNHIHMRFACSNPLRILFNEMISTIFFLLRRKDVKKPNCRKKKCSFSRLYT